MKKLLFLLATCAYAQYPLQDAPYQVVYTANGVAVPCSGCYLYTYSAGTTTPLATYTSSTLGVALPNPVRTNSAGYAVSGSGAITGIWVAAAACYHLVFKNAAAVTVWDQDHICTPASGPGAGTLTSATITAGTGISLSGTCTSTTILNCTVAASPIHTFNFNVAATGQTLFIQTGNYSCTIIGWSLNSDVVGTVSADVYVHTNSAWPSAPAVPATKISASAPIATSSAIAASGGTSAISTWTKSIPAYETIAINVTTFTTATFAVATIYCQ